MLPAAIALVVAVVGAVGLLAALGGSSEGTAREWLSRVDRLCDEAADRLGRMPPVHIATYDDVVPTMAESERALALELGALQVPAQERPAVGRLVSLLDRQADQVDGAARTYGAEGGFAAYKQHLRRVYVLDKEIDEAARSLGAGACARPVIRSRYL